jgi:hypothetical protein
LEHKEIIQFIRDFFNQTGLVIFPSTSMSDYETFSDWEIGCKKHYEMSALYEVLREFFQLRKVIESQVLGNQDLSSDERTAKMLALIEKYKIQKIVIRGTGQEICLDC